LATAAKLALPSHLTLQKSSPPSSRNPPTQALLLGPPGIKPTAHAEMSGTVH
jgi:hypothetical protein